MAYRGDHRSQYDPGASTRLRRMGCTPTSTANALRCATGGRIDLSGDQVLAEVAIAEESHPLTPGWSLEDAQLAVSRIAGAPPMQIHSGYWSDVVALLAAGYGVIQQGDSDQFLTGCSGTFDGDHCVFIHPDQLGPMQWLADPICPDWRLEWPLTLEHYAVKLFGLRLRYGVITAIIPPDDATPPDTGTPEMGPTLTEGRPIGSAYIPAGARFMPLDGSPAGVFPTERRQEFVAEGYNLPLNKRGIVVGTGSAEFAFVPDGYSDLVWYDLRAGQPAPDCAAAIAADRAKAHIVWEE